MKHKSSINIFNNDEIPKIISQREEVTCPLCHKKILIAVPPELIDWESVAELYLKMNMEFVKRTSDTIQDLIAMYGENNPVVAFYNNEFLNMVNECKKRFNK